MSIDRTADLVEGERAGRREGLGAGTRAGDPTGVVRRAGCRAGDRISTRFGACDVPRPGPDPLRTCGFEPVSGRRRRRAGTIRTAATTDGELLAFDFGLRPGGAVPIPHVHPIQTERFEMLEGEMRFRVGLRTLVAGPGDVVEIAPGVAHSFANAGDAGLGYINSDVTLYLHRLPVTRWIGFDVVNHHASEGVAIGECWLYDEKGAIGTSTVAALAQRKPMTNVPPP